MVLCNTKLYYITELLASVYRLSFFINNIINAMRTGIIYGYTNLESGKMYIGQTVYPERRWNDHRYGKYKTGWHKDYQNNPDKYEYSVIEYNVPEDKLDEREIFWISFFDSYHNVYNLSPCVHSYRR